MNDESIVSEVITTELANFLATSYEVPPVLMQIVFEKADGIDERNFNLFTICFFKFMSDAKKIDYSKRENFPTRNELLAIIEDNFYEFLAHAVMKRYSKTILIK